MADSVKTFRKGRKPNPQHPNDVDDLDSAVQDIVNRSDSKQRSMIDVLKDLVRVFHDDQTKTIDNRNVKIVDELCRVHSKELVKSLKKGDFNEQVAELLDLLETEESKSRILNSISSHLGLTKQDILDYVADSIQDVVEDISEQTTTEKKQSSKNQLISKEQFYEKAFDEKVGKVYYDNIGRFCRNRIRDRLKYRTQQLSKDKTLFPKSLINLNDKLNTQRKENLSKKIIKSGVVSSIIGKLKNKKTEDLSIQNAEGKDDEKQTNEEMKSFWSQITIGFNSTYSFITGHLQGFWKKFPKNLVKIGKKFLKTGFFGLVRVFCLPAFAIVKGASVLFGLLSGLSKVVLGCFGVIYNGISKIASVPLKIISWVGGKFLKGFKLLAKGINKILNTSIVKSLVKFIFTPTGAFVTGYIAGFLYKTVFKRVFDKWGHIKEVAEEMWSSVKESWLRLQLKGQKTALSLVEGYNSFVNAMSDPSTPIGSVVEQFKKNGIGAGLNQSWLLFKKNTLWKLKDIASALKSWFCSMNGPAALALGSAGSFVGGMIGTFVGGPVGAIVGSVLGGLVGGLAGSAVTKSFFDPLEQSINEKKEILSRNQLFMDLYGGRQTTNLLDSALQNASEEDMKNSVEYARMKKKRDAIDALDVQKARTKSVDKNGNEVENDVDMDSFVREQEKKSDRFVKEGSDNDTIVDIEMFMSGLLLRRKINQYKSGLVSAQGLVDYCNMFDGMGSVPKECLDEPMGISTNQYFRDVGSGFEEKSREYSNGISESDKNDKSHIVTVPSTIGGIIDRFLRVYNGKMLEKSYTDSNYKEWMSAEGMKTILWRETSKDEKDVRDASDIGDQEDATRNARDFIDKYFQDKDLGSVVPAQWEKDNKDGRMSNGEFDGKKDELFRQARFIAYRNALAHGYSTQEDANRLMSLIKDALAPETEFEFKKVRDSNLVIKGFDNIKPVDQSVINEMKGNITEMEKELKEISKKNEENRKKKEQQKKDQIGTVEKMKRKLKNKTENLKRRRQVVRVVGTGNGQDADMSASSGKANDKPKLKVIKRG